METENYLEIEENLMLMRCMVDNLHLVSTSNEIEGVASSALFGITVTLDKQLRQVETKFEELWKSEKEQTTTNICTRTKKNRENEKRAL